MYLYLPLEPADFNDLDALYETYLNGGVKIREHLAKDFSSSGYLGIKCLTESGALAGMASSKPGIDFTVSRPQLEAKLKALCGNRRVYTGDMTVVLPAYRKQGVSHGLARRMIDMLEASGTEMYLTELWIHPDGFIPAEKLYAKFGKTVYSEDIPMFYKQLQRDGVVCPICGAACRCGARASLLDITR